MQGTVLKYGNNVDTDVIIPARYLNTTNKKELASHCMEDIDPTFAGRVKQGDILVAGENFGCGSSREHAPIAILESGIALIVAESFARIFYRNAINIGLPIVECPAASREANEGDLLEADLQAGKLYNRTQNKEYAVAPFPPFLQKIIEAKGLLNALEKGAFQ